MIFNDKVMQGAVLKASLLICATVLLGGSCVGGRGVVCKQGESWWDADRATCVECTRCNTPDSPAVLTPCEVHRDTVCTPLHQLDIDWSWLPWAAHHLQHNRRNDRNRNDDETDENETEHIDKVEWRFSTNLEHSPIRGSVAKAPSSDEIIDLEYEFPAYDSDAYSVTERPTALRPRAPPAFAWDAQTSSLSLAAFACVVFFAVVASYSVYHTHQWRRFKANLDTDVERVSAKLLMLAAADAEAAVDPARHYTNVAAGGGAGGAGGARHNDHKLIGHNTRTSGAGNVYIQEKHKHVNDII